MVHHTAFELAVAGGPKPRSRQERLSRVGGDSEEAEDGRLTEPDSRELPAPTTAQKPRTAVTPGARLHPI